MSTATTPFRPPAGARLRVISDNDYAGDPDGLFQLAHTLLSPSLDVRAVIGSHFDFMAPSGRSATDSVQRARDVIDLMELPHEVAVVEGSNYGLTDTRTP